MEWLWTGDSDFNSPPEILHLKSSPVIDIEETSFYKMTENKDQVYVFKAPP